MDLSKLDEELEGLAETIPVPAKNECLTRHESAVLGVNLGRAMNQHRIGYYQAAEAIGCTHSAVRNFVRPDSGRRTKQTAELVARAMGIDVVTLTTRVLSWKEVEAIKFKRRRPAERTVRPVEQQRLPMAVPWLPHVARYMDRIHNSTQWSLAIYILGQLADAAEPCTPKLITTTSKELK